MAKNLILSLFSVLILVLISCGDNTNEPTDNSLDSGKYVFYTRVEGSANIVDIWRYNLETGKVELFKESSAILGIANKRIFYMTANMAAKEVTLWQCNSKGGDVKQIKMKNQDILSYALLSPDGTKILYYTGEEDVQGFDIHCANIDGSGDNVIFTSMGDFEGEPMAAFSADSKKIGVNAQEYNMLFLFTCNTDGSNFKAEKPLHGFGYMQGGFAPDGKRVAYNNLDGFDYHIEFDSANIAIYDISTGQDKVITSDGNISYQLTWSPDGSKLAFYRHPGKLCIMNADGTNLRQASCSGILLLPYCWWYDIKISWSPDGSQVMYKLMNKDDINNNDLFIVDAATMNTRTILSNVYIYDAFWY